jgi:hypothetical protein
MAVTEVFYSGDNITVLYAIPFPYLDPTDVNVTLDGTVTTAFTFANASTIQFNTAPGYAVRIRIYRATLSAEPTATIYPGSSIKADDLNDNFKQNLFTTQETQNSISSEIYFYRLPQDRALTNSTSIQSVFGKSITLPTGKNYLVEAVIVAARPSAAYSAHDIQFTWSDFSGRIFAEGARNFGSADGVFEASSSRTEAFIYGQSPFLVTGPLSAGTNSISVYCKFTGTTEGDFNLNPRIRFTSAPGAAAVYSVFAGSYIKLTRIEPILGTWV